MENYPESSAAGTSVGHWESQTLVVETRLNSDANVFSHYLKFFGFSNRVGKNARVSERISLRDPDTLAMSIVLNAPELLSRSAQITWLYHRNRNYDMAVHHLPAKRPYVGSNDGQATH